MKKMLNKTIAAVIAVIMLFCMSGCNVSLLGNTKSFAADLLWESDKICARPTEASYDKDGQFIVVFGVTNSTKYAKIVHSITVTSIKDIKNRDIIEGSEFELDSPQTLLPGKSTYIQCDFEKEKVLLKTGLNTLNSDITINYYGCMKNGSAPAVSDKEGFAMTVTDAVFNEGGALEGKIAIRNNYKSDMTPKTISFSLKSNTGETVTKQDVVITNESAVKAGETISFSFTIAPNNVKDAFAESQVFDYLTPVYTIK